ncbi:hypothetical protein ACWC3X_00795 [Streptomyces populi]|jgi:hypothetical protein
MVAGTADGSRGTHPEHGADAVAAAPSGPLAHVVAPPPSAGCRTASFPGPAAGVER